MAILVTGGSGFVGTHLQRAAVEQGLEVVAPSSLELDLRDPVAVHDAVEALQPSAIVHLAYRRDDESLIVEGSRSVARAAALVRARLVHVSTDVVFAGREAAYVESDPTDASLPYGRFKAAAEHAVTTSCDDAVLVRTSLVYGTWLFGAIERDVRAACATGSEMRFFTDEIRCPIAGDDLAAALLALTSLDVRGPLHVAGPTAISRADLARLVAAHMGIDPARVPTATIADSGLARPGRVVLDTSAAAALGLRARSPAAALRPLP